MSALATLWRRNRWLVMAFGAALTVTLFLAVRATVFWLHWSDPAMRDRPIEGWMTPRYVAMSWQVPREVMLGAVGLSPDARPSGGPERIAAIAARLGKTEAALIAEIEAAIAAFRASEGGAGQ